MILLFFSNRFLIIKRWPYKWGNYWIWNFFGHWKLKLGLDRYILCTIKLQYVFNMTSYNYIILAYGLQFRKLWIVISSPWNWIFSCWNFQFSYFVKNTIFFSSFFFVQNGFPLFKKDIGFILFWYKLTYFFPKGNFFLLSIQLSMNLLIF